MHSTTPLALERTSSWNPSGSAMPDTARRSPAGGPYTSTDGPPSGLVAVQRRPKVLAEMDLPQHGLWRLADGQAS